MSDLVTIESVKSRLVTVRGGGGSKVENFDLRTVGGFAIKKFDRNSRYTKERGCW